MLLLVDLWIIDARDVMGLLDDKLNGIEIVRFFIVVTSVEGRRSDWPQVDGIPKQQQRSRTGW